MRIEEIRVSKEDITGITQIFARVITDIKEKSKSQLEMLQSLEVNNKLFDEKV